MCAACYLVSYSVLPAHNRSVWFARASDDDRKVYREWIKSANFRASQTGMHSLACLVCLCALFVLIYLCVHKMFDSHLDNLGSVSSGLL